MIDVNARAQTSVHNVGRPNCGGAMGYRSFLVQVDDTDQSDRRVRLAARLARSYGADLQGVYLSSARAITPFAAAMLPDAVVESRLHETGKAQAGAESRFRAGAAAEQLTAVSWSAPAGPAIDAAILHMCYADIVVVGQPLPEDAHAGFASDLLYEMMMGAGKPLLVVPHYGEYPVVGQSVLIAWKESRESTRAVCDALPLLKRAGKVVVMMIASPEDDRSAGAQSGAAITGYLARHGIVATVRPEVADDIDVGEVLLSRAADLSTDLIVMGAYSRGRMTERVLGGVTRLMLQSMTVPVLMSH